jgi:hypothetical protein
MASFELDNLCDRLWRNNWLNVRKATELAKTRTPRKMYVAFELANTVIDSTGKLYPFALETLSYIRTGSHYHTLASTYLPNEYVTNLIRTYNMKVDWVNTNPHFQTTTKPYYDVYIDVAAGFDPGEWKYVLFMFQKSEQILSLN